MFRVFLGRTWRRIAISGQHVLDDLSAAILNAYEFDFDHLYRFTWADRFGMTAEADHPYMEDEAPPADKVRIGDLLLPPGDTMSYLYDFGDNWEFEVELEKIDPPDPNMKEPVLLESRRKSPEQYYTEEDWEE